MIDVQLDHPRLSLGLLLPAVTCSSRSSCCSERRARRDLPARCAVLLLASRDVTGKAEGNTLNVRVIERNQSVPNVVLGYDGENGEMRSSFLGEPTLIISYPDPSHTLLQCAKPQKIL